MTVPYTKPTATPEPGGVPINRNPPPPPPIGTVPPVRKRNRKPWVYQYEYDKLKDRKDAISAWAIAGWLILILYVTFDVLTN